MIGSVFGKERKTKLTKRIAALTGLVSLSWLCAGCLQTKLTSPPRSAVEQLLLSTAADRAIRTVSLSSFAGQKVYVATNYWESYDPLYALGTLRDALSQAGALLVDAVTNAEVVVEPRSGALSIDSTESLIGIPKTGVPIPFAGAVEIPEMALYKSEKEYSTAKFAVLAFKRVSGKHYFSSGRMVGRAYMKYYKFLGLISYTSTDIPEKTKHKKKKAHQPTFEKLPATEPHRTRTRSD